MTNTEISTLFQSALFALLLGMVGQAIRAAAGLNKQADKAAAAGGRPAEAFDVRLFWSTLFIGAIAGLTAYLGMQYGTSEGADLQNGKVVLGIAAAGYAGADFIDGFVRKFLPQR